MAVLTCSSMALIHEICVFDGSTADTGTFFSSMAQQNLGSILTAIANMAKYWISVDPIRKILEQSMSTLHAGTNVENPARNLLQSSCAPLRYHCQIQGS